MHCCIVCTPLMKTHWIHTLILNSYFVLSEYMNLAQIKKWYCSVSSAVTGERGLSLYKLIQINISVITRRHALTARSLV